MGPQAIYARHFWWCIGHIHYHKYCGIRHQPGQMGLWWAEVLSQCPTWRVSDATLRSTVEEQEEFKQTLFFSYEAFGFAAGFHITRRCSGDKTVIESYLLPWKIQIPENEQPLLYQSRKLILKAYKEEEGTFQSVQSTWQESSWCCSTRILKNWKRLACLRPPDEFMAEARVQLEVLI